MTTVEDIDGYFRSLNSITRKIWNDKENVKNSFGEESWNRLSEDEQAELFNKYIIDDSIRQKYVNVEKEETPEMFPMMKINCGELIAADNQNDNVIQPKFPLALLSFCGFLLLNYILMLL